MAVNPVDAMTWKARELKISYGILLTQITEEERQEILEEYEEMLQKKEAEHQERLRQKAGDYVSHMGNVALARRKKVKFLRNLGKVLAGAAVGVAFMLIVIFWL